MGCHQGPANANAPDGRRRSVAVIMQGCPRRLRVVLQKSQVFLDAIDHPAASRMDAEVVDPFNEHLFSRRRVFRLFFSREGGERKKVCLLTTSKRGGVKCV